MEKPKIRFKGYQEDWEQRKFGDLADYKKGPFGSAITKDIFVPKSEESIKVYEQQNAINKDWELERYFLPKEYALTKLKSFEVQGGDIIVSCAGTIGEIYEIPENADTGVINQALMRVRVDEDCVDKRMFKIAFSNMIDDFTRVHSNGSAIKNIPPFSDLKPMGVLLPSLQEQKKISSYFEKLDNLITLHQRKCEEMKTLKKYMLQKMFPQNGQLVPQIRFSGFTEDWEQRKLNEIADKVSEKNKNNEFSEPFTNSAEQGIISQKDYFDREIVNNENLNGYYIVRNDDFIYNPRISVTAPVGPINRNRLGRNGVMSPLYTVFRTHDIDNLYLEFYFKTTRWHRFMKLNGDSGVRFDRFTISSTQFMEMPIPYPTLEEQQKIGEYFESLDHLITLHQQKCDELRNIKKFMLQNMFI